MMLRNLLLTLVALEHLYFLTLEMFLWTKPLGLKTFRMTREQAEDRAVLAANQGLYNGFLAAGTVWAIVQPDTEFSRQLAVFFMGCVLLAAIYGGYSVNRRILMIQGIPALLALIATLVGGTL
jgi:putative membrane protein